MSDNNQQPQNPTVRPPLRPLRSPLRPLPRPPRLPQSATPQSAQQSEKKSVIAAAIGELDPGVRQLSQLLTHLGPEDPQLEPATEQILAACRDISQLGTHLEAMLDGAVDAEVKFRVRQGQERIVELEGMLTAMDLSIPPPLTVRSGEAFDIAVLEASDHEKITQRAQQHVVKTLQATVTRQEGELEALRRKSIRCQSAASTLRLTMHSAPDGRASPPQDPQRLLLQEEVKQLTEALRLSEAARDELTAKNQRLEHQLASASSSASTVSTPSPAVSTVGPPVSHGKRPHSVNTIPDFPLAKRSRDDAGPAAIQSTFGRLSTNEAGPSVPQSLHFGTDLNTPRTVGPAAHNHPSLLETPQSAIRPSILQHPAVQQSVFQQSARQQSAQQSIQQQSVGPGPTVVSHGMASVAVGRRDDDRRPSSAAPANTVEALDVEPSWWTKAKIYSPPAGHSANAPDIL